MKKRYIVLLAIVVCVITVELILRLGFGFCDALLYQNDSRYEYIAQPLQQRRRFGARILVNSYSQRSDEPDTTRVIVLGLGDSVLFGGTMIDHDSLATTLFSAITGMQMLNISAGSWGPDNCAAYINAHGTFGARVMLLVCSSHDGYDIMSHAPVVGVFSNYPDHQYVTAIGELMQRYVMPRWRYWLSGVRFLDPDEQIADTEKVLKPVTTPVSAEEKQAVVDSVPAKSTVFNPGFAQLKEISEQAGIPFIIYLHAEKGELMAGTYNSMGRQIIAWAADNDVPLYQDLQMGTDLSMYRDIIHPNEKGQRKMAQDFIPIIENALSATAE